LKVRWAAVDGFREHEARWNRIDELGIGDDPVGRAAEVVFETLIDHDVARMEHREYRCMSHHKLEPPRRHHRPG
jgi:hypothetical protein